MSWDLDRVRRAEATFARHSRELHLMAARLWESEMADRFHVAEYIGVKANNLRGPKGNLTNIAKEVGCSPQWAGRYNQLYQRFPTREKWLVEASNHRTWLEFVEFGVKSYVSPAKRDRDYMRFTLTHRRLETTHVTPDEFHALLSTACKAENIDKFAIYLYDSFKEAIPRDNSRQGSES